MKKNFFLCVLLTIAFSLSAQTFGSWRTSSSRDPFAGNYKAITSTGSGGQHPYSNPKMIINWFEKTGDVNIQLTDAGYSGCDNLSIQIVFDSEDTIHYFRSGSNREKDTWVFGYFKGEIRSSSIASSVNPSRYHFYESKMARHEFYEKMKKHNTMHVKLSSSCGTIRFQVSLNGFSRAFNWILPDYDPTLFIEEERIEKEKMDKIAEQKELFNLLINQLIETTGGSSFNTAADYEKKIVLPRDFNPELIKSAFDTLQIKFPQFIVSEPWVEKSRFSWTIQLYCQDPLLRINFDFNPSVRMMEVQVNN